MFPGLRTNFARTMGKLFGKLSRISTAFRYSAELSSWAATYSDIDMMVTFQNFTL